MARKSNNGPKALYDLLSFPKPQRKPKPAPQPVEDAEHRAARVEWEQWQAVCRAGVEAGAWTQDDLKRPTSDRGSPGLRLLHEIRRWAETVGDLRMEQYRTNSGRR